MNGSSASGVMRTNLSAFKTSATKISSLVVFRNITKREFALAGLVATNGGRLKLSTSFRSSVALASAASVARRALFSADSAARRAALDLLEAHQDQRPKRNDAPANPTEIQISITQTYTDGVRRE